MLKTIFAAIIAACLVSLGLQAGDTFYWKNTTSDFGLWSNWAVGSQNGSNPDCLLPGAEDAVFCSADATWNLGGNEYAIKEWQDSFDDWTRATITLKNGELNVMSRSSRNDTINLENGASLVFPKGSCYYPSIGCGGAERVLVKEGCRFSVSGKFSPYRISLETLRYGTAIVDPDDFSIYSGSAQSNTFIVAGTNIFPRGLVWNGSGTAACWLDIHMKWSGRMLASGAFDRNGNPGTFRLVVDGNGSVIESIGDVSFSGVDECNVLNGMTFTANEGHTIDASNFTYYKNAHDENGKELVCYKLGAGTLAIGSELPPKFQINGGTVAVKTTRSDLNGMVFLGNPIVLRYDVPGCRLDEITNEIELGRVKFESGMDLSALSSGVVLFASANESIRTAMYETVSKDVPDGFEVKIVSDEIVLTEYNPNTFDSSKGLDLSDVAAWKNGSVPVGEEVVVTGGGTVVLDSDSPVFSKVTVIEGTTLRMEGGTESNPFTPPQLAMNYKSKIICAEGSNVKLVNEIEGVAIPASMPVFEIATNSVLHVETPNHATEGFSFKNLHLNFFGTIKCPDATAHSVPCVTFGSADEGEVSYFGMAIDGGRLFVRNLVNDWHGNASLVRIMCAKDGGAVYPAGELVCYNFVKEPESCTLDGTTYLANSGFHIGVGNPPGIVFTLKVSGTPLGFNGTSRISGGAVVVCTGTNSGLVKSETFYSYSLTQHIDVDQNARIVLRDGARFSIPFCVGDSGLVYFKPTDDGFTSLEIDGGITELYNIWKYTTAKVLVKDAFWDIGRLMPESVTAPETGWLGKPYSSVLSGFHHIELSGLLQVRATDAFPRPSWWNFEGYWDHEVEFTDMPVGGTGSILVTNTTANNSMTLTMVNKGNLATGTIAAAPGTRSKLLFKDDANWAGTVVANGCAGLVNTDSTTGKEKAAVVKFKNILMDGEFPIRVWNTDSCRTNDFIEITGTITGVEGGFCGVPMDGRNPKSGDSYRIATYPASSGLPVNNVPRWILSSVPHETDASKVVLVLTYQPPGTTIILR